MAFSGLSVLSALVPSRRLLETMGTEAHVSRMSPATWVLASDETLPWRPGQLGTCVGERNGKEATRQPPKWGGPTGSHGKPVRGSYPGLRRATERRAEDKERRSPGQRERESGKWRGRLASCPHLFRPRMVSDCHVRWDLSVPESESF